jgi:hypothetical protein
MAKVIRAHQIQGAAQKMFGSKVADLQKIVSALSKRVAFLESKLGQAAPVEASFEVEEIKENILSKGELPNASGVER